MFLCYRALEPSVPTQTTKSAQPASDLGSGNPYLPPASVTLNTHPFFGLREQTPGLVVSVHGPVDMHESILRGILRSG